MGGQVATQGATFAANLLLANILGATTFGQYGFVVGTAQTVASVSQFAIGLAAIKFLAEYRIKHPALAVSVLRLCRRMSFVSGSLGSIVFVLIASGVLSSKMFGGPFSILAIASPLVLCSVVNALQVAALSGLDAYRDSALVAMRLAVTQVVAVAIGAHYFGLIGALSSLSGVLVARAVVTDLALKRTLGRQGLDISCAEPSMPWAKVLAYIAPSAISGTTNLPALWIATTSVLTSPGSFTEIARINTALSLRLALMVVPTAIAAVGFTQMNVALGQSDNVGHNRAMKRAVGLSGGAACLGAVFLILFSEPILRLYGDEFIRAKEVLVVLMFSLAAEAIALPLYQSLLSHRRVWTAMLATQLPRDLVVAGLGWKLGSSLGAIGVAYAHVAGWGLSLALCVAIAQRQMRR